MRFRSESWDFSNHVVGNSMNVAGLRGSELGPFASWSGAATGIEITATAVRSCHFKQRPAKRSPDT